MPQLLQTLGCRALALALASGLLLQVLFGAPAVAAAAEVLQVRNATLLQVGDSNRSYSVELACLAVEPDQQQPAIDWLRQQLPRRSRVNLRPMGNHDGILLARVQKLGTETDISSGLISAGLASLPPACSA